MCRLLLAIVVLATAACERGTTPAAPAQSTVAAASEPAASAGSAPVFTDRVWLRADEGSAPGAMQVFLSDGTLLTDSCFETYRLSSWRHEGDGIAWSEDGIEIGARIVAVDAGAMTLRLALRDGEQEQRFTAATVPYVCPDMAR